MTANVNMEQRPEPDDPMSTSTSLIARVKDRDAEAWQRLVDLYGPLVYQWSRQSGIRSDEAADVFQEVFIAVAANVADFRRDRPGDSFRGWLWTITRNKVRDHFRRRGARPEAQGGTKAQERMAQNPDSLAEPSPDEPEAAADNGLEHRALELVRAGVEERTWRAFWSLAVDGRTAAEVAEELDMNVRTVYEAKYRVLRMLRQELNDLMDQPG